MGVGGVSTNQYMTWNQAKRTQSSTASQSFSQQMDNVAAAQKKAYKVYMKTDDMLYSGGNGSGLSFYIKYAQGSTEEDPTVVAKGVDENGNEFEQTIHINDINPRCATIVQMRALEAYLGVDKNGGLSSLPNDPSLGNMGLYDRGDFISMFQKSIRDMNVLGERRLAAYYRYSMQMYWNFMVEREQDGKSAGVGAGALPGLSGNPLWRRMQGHSAIEDKSALQESKSDSEIITQPDGSRTLLITAQIGGMKMVTSIKLSEPSALQDEYAKPAADNRTGAGTETSRGCQTGWEEF